MKPIHAAATVLAVITATPALAQEQTSVVSAGVTGGTLGIGPEVAVRVSPLLALRANATFFGISHSVDSDDITYNGDLKLSSIGAMVDLHPFKNGFRLSGGLRVNDNKVELTATPDPAEVLRVGGTPYTAADVGLLTGTVNVDEFVPTLTVGYGGGLTKGLKFGIDAGVLFQGSPRIRNLAASGPLASNPVFQDALAREEQSIEDDVKKYDTFPILQFSLRYGF
ncbi:hypothetical protein ABVV53_09090 [Novosphingobium sp. RD2P27]|uniref:Outer membrane protein beta-barrel domain-containing protein n=1 Tax=Novosphingobium kalidii TaxID=3230299 RepID=A0ABV2D1P8_9SPHN